jgi:hypothetical protein
MSERESTYRQLKAVESIENGAIISSIVEARTTRALGKTVILMDQFGLKKPAGVELINPGYADEDDGVTIIRSYN